MSRDPHSIMHEADYWKALLDDVRELNTGVMEAASAIAELPVVVLMLLIGADSKHSTEEAQRKIGGAIASVGAMQPPIDRLISLATGRLIALRDEAGLEPFEPGAEL